MRVKTNPSTIKAYPSQRGKKAQWVRRPGRDQLTHQKTITSKPPTQPWNGYFFIDDMELALSDAYNINFKLDTPEERDDTDEHLEKYLNAHLKFKLNGNQASYQFIGKEYDFDLVRFYLEITDIEMLDVFELKNTCLIQQFDDQKNIVKLKVKNFHKTFYLDSKKHNCLLKF